MKIEERVFLILFILFNLFIHYKGLYESRYKKNAYHETPLLIILGICVWGDAVIFGLSEDLENRFTGIYSSFQI